MKLIRWMEQHIRGGRKKDKEDKEKGKQNKKNRKFQRGFDEAGSIVKLQENELQNSVREQTTSAVESLLGPLYTAREHMVTKTENNFKGNYNCNVALEPGSDRYAFGDDQQTEGEVYSEIPDTPPPPAPPSIANRIPLQHIRCIGQTAPSAVSDVISSAQHCSSETPKERSRIKTNPWFVSSPQSPCCSSSTSGDSGAWTATSSDRSGRTTHTQGGPTPQDNASHDWYYADSTSSTASLTKKASALKATQLYQNVLPLGEQALDSQKATGGRVLYRYPSGTHLSTAGNLNRWQVQRRPGSARTYRKSYFINPYGDDTPDFASSEDEAFSDDYQVESGTSDLPSVRRRLSRETRKFRAAHLTNVCANNGADVFDIEDKNESRIPVPGRRSSQAQVSYGSGIPEKQGVGSCFRNSSPLKVPCAKDDFSRPPKTVERQMRQQENLLLHRELLQFKQFLLMRTLENMGSELNMNRNVLFSSPQLRQRDFLRHRELQGLSPHIGLGQQPPTGHLAQVNDVRLPQHRQLPRAVAPHQSPRLVPSLNCSPLRGRNVQMSPRTPRLGRPIAHQLDQPTQISHMPQITRHEMGFDRLGHPTNVSLSNNSKLLCSPKPGDRVNPTASPVPLRIGRPLYAKPKGVPRTTTIDFQAFSSPSRKQTGETA